MQRKQLIVCVLLLSLLVFLPQVSQARVSSRVNARSAILIDMENGSILFEQNADSPIPPASITKILSLYLIFEAVKEGQVHLSDKVEVSGRAASTGGSRMGLRSGTRVTLEELIKGMAVVSGNDACVAAAEHLSGSVDRFVKRMNAKAQELGMTNSRFMTPNGLPAPGQVTTARDIAKLSTAYLRRFPESLTIHSMQGYTYGRSTHHNANRLLGKCPGVDGLKTGFVCASGYNISATARRNGTRILAVVMGARTPWIRLSETEKLIEAGFRECGAPHSEVKVASGSEGPAEIAPLPKKKAGRVAVMKSRSKKARVRSVHAVVRSSKGTALRKVSVTPGRKATKETGSVAAAKGSAKHAAGKGQAGKLTTASSKSVEAKVVRSAAKGGRNADLKPAKSKVENAKTAKKKGAGAKAVPHAQAMKKKAKG